MLALKFELRKPTKVVLVEVKSTSEACYYKETGVNAHYKAMKQYIICKKPEYMKIRKEEAIKIFNDYAAAGMRGLNEKNILMVNPSSLGEEILFIFTDDAREEIKNNNVPEHLKMKFEDGVLKSH